MPSILSDLADLLETFVKVLRDPQVQSAGDNFLRTLENATDRELGVAGPLRQAIAATHEQETYEHE